MSEDSPEGPFENQTVTSLSDTAQYERVEQAVEKMLREDGAIPNGEFTRWARNVAVEESKDAASVRDFPKSYENHVDKKFATSTPVEGKTSRRFFPSEESLECISARASPIVRNGRLPVVEEEKEPTQSTQNTSPKKPRKTRTGSQKEAAESVHPLTEQLRSLIQLLDIQQIEMRKRHEAYFKQMKEEVEAGRAKMREEGAAMDLEFRRRERALNERERLIDKNESDKLSEMKERLKKEIDMKNEKSVEIHKLRSKIAELESTEKASRKAILSRRRSTQQQVELQPSKLQQTEPEPSRRQCELAKMRTRLSSANRTIEVQPPAVRRCSDSSRNKVDLSSYLASEPTRLSSVTKTIDVQPPEMICRSLPCGCEQFFDSTGAFREWKCKLEGTTVALSDDSKHIELFAPGDIKMTFDSTNTVYVLLPDRTGLVLYGDGRYKIGRYLEETIEGKGQFKVDNVEGISCFTYDEDQSVGWAGRDISLRCSKGWSKARIGSVLQFNYVVSRVFYVYHIDVSTTPPAKTLCFQHEWK